MSLTCPNSILRVKKSLQLQTKDGENNKSYNEEDTSSSSSSSSSSSWTTGIIMPTDGIDAVQEDPAAAYPLRTNASLQQLQSQQQQSRGDPQQQQQPLLFQTLSGGPSLIFEMARRMLVWDDPTSSSSTTTTTTSSTTRVLPRWHPHGGISDVNPAFRTRPPVMSSQGYAATIWRNVRKRNKPSLWRHALRTYHRMNSNSNNNNENNNNHNTNEPSGAGGESNLATTMTATTVSSSSSLSPATTNKQIPQTNVHFEGALLACAKLGLWRRALQIYRQVEQLVQEGNPSSSSSSSSSLFSSSSSSSSSTNPPQSSRKSSSSSSSTFKNTKNNFLSDSSSHNIIAITECMVLSVVKACVRGSKHLHKNDATLEECREPLDTALQLLLTIEERHGIPLVARHLNPLAAAYQALGMLSESSTLLRRHLHHRTRRDGDGDGGHRPPQEAKVGDDDPSFNVHDVGAKNKASYALLVTAAVSTGDWAEAVQALGHMTNEAGLYPTARHLNRWTEVSERKSRQRTTRSWKKKRNEYWMESLR